MNIETNYLKQRMFDFINWTFNWIVFNVSVQIIYAIIIAFIYQTLDPYTYIYLNDDKDIIGFSYTLFNMLNLVYVLISYVTGYYILDLKKIIKL